MSLNFQQGLASGMQGAKLGGKFGGLYGAIGGGILGLVLGGSDNSAEKAAKQYNDQVVKFAAQDLFDMRRQQNIQNARASQALEQYQTNNKVQGSTINANMGAADIIGSSAQALKQTLAFQTQEAMAQTLANWDVGIANYNTTIDRNTNQRAASLQRSTGQQGADLGSLISAGVDLYNEYGAEVKSRLQRTEHTTHTIYQFPPVSLMGSMREVWEGGTGVGLASAGLFEPFKGYNDFDDEPVMSTPNITPIL